MTSQPPTELADNSIPPPSHVQPIELTQAELAQIRIPRKRSFFSFVSSKSRGSVKESQNEQGVERVASTSHPERSRSKVSSDSEVEDTPFVKIGGDVLYSEELMEDYSKDVYRWAVLYENQRGITFFSTPYYSRMPLLPIDPPAFTVPSTSKIDRTHQPSLSPSTYPLPDGSWRWVSRTWMVDMRGDGQTQYEGFEYNWHFRTKHWRPKVGFFSAGGWVRRRRWVRLMMRPAIARQNVGDATSHTTSPLLGGIIPRPETGATRPPSVLVILDDEDVESSLRDPAVVWKGQAEEDWEQCRRALKRLDRDGKKLELWKRWLRDVLPPPTDADVADRKGKKPRKQWTEDEFPLPSQHLRSSTGTVDDMLIADTGASTAPAEREHVTQVLRTHLQEIIRMFVYPDSRTQFIQLLVQADLLSVLELSPSTAGGLSASSSMLDFWSSSQSLQYISADEA